MLFEGFEQFDQLAKKIVLQSVLIHNLHIQPYILNIIIIFNYYQDIKTAVCLNHVLFACSLHCSHYLCGWCRHWLTTTVSTTRTGTNWISCSTCRQTRS